MCNLHENTYAFSTRQAVQLNKKLNIEGLIQRALNQLYNDRKVDKKTAKELAKSHYEPLRQAVEEGYGKSLFKVEYNTPNYEFLKALQTNAAVFATFKSHAATKQMTGLLKDAEGNLKPKEQFVREALAVDNTYRKQHLDTEYDTAVRQARMAANWQRYERNKRLYPNLRYVQSKAAKPDEKHLAFVGIVRPVDDPFWNTHYPPNRWRCQCSVEPTDAEATDIPDKLPPVDPAFAFNSGKTQQVFKLEQSDYFKDAAPKDIPRLFKTAKFIVDEIIAENIPYQPIYKSKSGSLVEAHPMAFDNNDIDDCIKAARKIANMKKDAPDKMQVLPDIGNLVLREQLLPDAPGLKNPDYREYRGENTKIFDLKIPENEKASKSTIPRNIRNAHEQGKGIVLLLGDESYISEKQLYADIDSKLHYPAYDEFSMYLEYRGEMRYFTKESWVAFYKNYKKKNPHQEGGGG